MIFNCECCGKSISSKLELCIYCKADITEFSLAIEQSAILKARKNAIVPSKILAKLKGTFASVR